MNHPTSAYIHLPFCRRRCYYCDFAITVVGDKPLKNNSILVSDYVEHLCQEIKLNAVSSQPLKTIFFGGGTPSLLPVVQLEKVLNTLNYCLGIDNNAEISLEIDPGTFDYQQLKQYLDLGINRFSLGIQTFKAELLAICGRTHDLKDVYLAIDLIQQAGIENYSIDLITGLPQQTLADCQQSLEEALKIAPPHISGYDLVLEPVTAFGKQYQAGIKPLPTDETTAQMYCLTQKMLTESGYQHYEISNYAKSGYQCRHNRVYWLNQPYYGFGMSAASYVNQTRFTRPRTRKTYYEWVQKGAVIDATTISKNDYLLETLMLGLRLTEGVNLSAIAKEHGNQTQERIVNCLQPYLEQQLVTISEQKNTVKLRLNDPEGFLLSNTILADLFETLE